MQFRLSAPMLDEPMLENRIEEKGIISSVIFGHPILCEQRTTFDLPSIEWMIVN